jgi:hypothetical protein
MQVEEATKKWQLQWHCFQLAVAHVQHSQALHRTPQKKFLLAHAINDGLDVRLECEMLHFSNRNPTGLACVM